MIRSTENVLGSSEVWVRLERQCTSVIVHLPTFWDGTSAPVWIAPAGYGSGRKSTGSESTEPVYSAGPGHITRLTKGAGKGVNSVPVLDRILIDPKLEVQPCFIGS
jgi:hypothetical protein